MSQQRLLSLLCSDFPLDVSASVLAAIGKRDGDLVSFDEFSVAVRACLQYETFFAKLDSVFATCDVDGVGQVGWLAEGDNPTMSPEGEPTPAWALGPASALSVEKNVRATGRA